MAGHRWQERRERPRGHPQKQKDPVLCRRGCLRLLEGEVQSPAPAGSVYRRLSPEERRRQRQEMAQRHRLLLHLLGPQPLRRAGHLPVQSRQTPPPRPQDQDRQLRRRPRPGIRLLHPQIHLRRLRTYREWIYGFTSQPRLPGIRRRQKSHHLPPRRRYYRLHPRTQSRILSS